MGQERTKNQSPSFFFILWPESENHGILLLLMGEMSGTIILWLQVIKRIKRQRVGKILIFFPLLRLPEALDWLSGKGPFHTEGALK